MTHNHFTKSIFILPILLVVFGLSGCDMKWGTQKGEFQEFDLNGTKVSFIPPHGWECEAVPIL
ncbi:MAG: hypothetical protein CR972_05000 [Candidatus Moraniibacteriota bacterium]|nr:MAG: hypothetical protein CR972_05000 [Candidatus Moranbacteria bacterium]